MLCLCSYGSNPSLQAPPPYPRVAPDLGLGPWDSRPATANANYDHMREALTPSSLHSAFSTSRFRLTSASARLSFLPALRLAS